MSDRLHLVNSECGAYLAIDHSLDKLYPKMLLFSSLISSLTPGLKPSFLISISISSLFGFPLLLYLVSCRTGILLSPFFSL